MFKKMQIARKLNGRVYIQFPCFYDLLNERNVEAIKEISGLFSQYFFYKLTYKHNSEIKFLNGIIKEKTYQIKKDKNTSIIIFRSEISILSQILNEMNYETDSLEIIKYTENFDLSILYDFKDGETDFIFYFSDNDGPYIIFDRNFFEYKSTLLKIKAILNKRFDERLL